MDDILCGKICVFSGIQGIPACIESLSSWERFVYGEEMSIITHGLFGGSLESWYVYIFKRKSMMSSWWGTIPLTTWTQMVSTKQNFLSSCVQEETAGASLCPWFVRCGRTLLHHQHRPESGVPEQAFWVSGLVVTGAVSVI